LFKRSSVLEVMLSIILFFFFFFSSRRRHTRCYRDWSSDVCSSDLLLAKNVAIFVFPSASAKMATFFANNPFSSQTGSPPFRPPRSEERRVGKECRSLSSTKHCKKKHTSVQYSGGINREDIR